MLKKKFANGVNVVGELHHKNDPMPYPIIAPKIDPNEQIRANLKDLFCDPKHSAIRRTSGGIGKNEASAKAINPKANGPYLESAHFNTQL